MTTETQRAGWAATTWDDDGTVRRMGHRAYFERFGFTVLRQVLSPAEVAEAVAEVDRIVARRADLPNVRVIGTRDPLLPSHDLEDRGAGDSAHPPIRKITGVQALSPRLASLVIEPARLVDVLHDLLGDRVELYRDALMMKPARVGQEKAWHQDAVYWPFRPMKLISAMLAIDPADPENGCLQVIPRSHRAVFAHQKINAELRLDVTSIGTTAVYVPLGAGDCLIFHSLLLHASEANTSDRDRRVSISSYSPGGLASLDPQTVPPLLLSDRSSA